MRSLAIFSLWKNIQCTGINHFVIVKHKRIPIYIDSSETLGRIWGSLKALHVRLLQFNTVYKSRASKLWVVGNLTERIYHDPSTREAAQYFQLTHWFLEDPFVGAVWNDDSSFPSGGYYTEGSFRTTLTVDDFEAWFVEHNTDFDPTKHLMEEHTEND